MDTYTKVLEFFMDNGILLNPNQMVELKSVCENDVYDSCPKDFRYDELVDLVKGIQNNNREEAAEKVKKNRESKDNDVKDVEELLRQNRAAIKAKGIKYRKKQEDEDIKNIIKNLKEKKKL